MNINYYSKVSWSLITFTVFAFVLIIVGHWNSVYLFLLIDIMNKIKVIMQIIYLHLGAELEFYEWGGQSNNKHKNLSNLRVLHENYVIFLGGGGHPYIFEDFN